MQPALLSAGRTFATQYVSKTFGSTGRWFGTRFRISGRHFVFKAAHILDFSIEHRIPAIIGRTEQHGPPLPLQKLTGGRESCSGGGLTAKIKSRPMIRVTSIASSFRPTIQRKLAESDNLQLLGRLGNTIASAKQTRFVRKDWHAFCLFRARFRDPE
jgi:hypothetical protein